MVNKPLIRPYFLLGTPPGFLMKPKTLTTTSLRNWVNAIEIHHIPMDRSEVDTSFGRLFDRQNDKGSLSMKTEKMDPLFERDVRISEIIHPGSLRVCR